MNSDLKLKVNLTIVVLMRRSAFMAPLSYALKLCSKTFLSDILTINKRWISKSKVSMFLDVRNKDHEKKCKELVVRQSEFFDEVAGNVKTKETFQEAIDLYLKRNVQNRFNLL